VLVLCGFTVCDAMCDVVCDVTLCVLFDVICAAYDTELLMRSVLLLCDAGTTIRLCYCVMLLRLYPPPPH
jgi:hypothetical protein